MIDFIDFNVGTLLNIVLNIINSSNTVSRIKFVNNLNDFFVSLMHGCSNCMWYG